MTLEAGARLGHYRIIALLGRGGMADVYRAEDERLGREVALKAVPPEFARDPERVERFEREVRAAARLTHPNIVTVYEFGQGAGQHFYTMALMPGGDLKTRIRAHPDGMPPEEARAVAAAMAAGTPAAFAPAPARTLPARIVGECFRRSWCGTKRRRRSPGRSRPARPHRPSRASARGALSRCCR